MHDLYKLKDMLCKELEEYGAKGELTAGTLDTVDKLAHAVKNLDKIIELYEDDEYSGAMRGTGAIGGYRVGNSYARGRGRNAKRDSMGRYSSERGYSRDAEELADKLRDLMHDAPDEAMRHEIERLVNKVESM